MIGALVLLGRILVWTGLALCAGGLLGIAIIGLVEAGYDLARPFYNAFGVGFVLVFLAAAILGLTPDQPYKTGR